jgi:hypothetical protein
MGAAAHHADFTVSLYGLPPAHLRVLLDGLPVFEQYGDLALRLVADLTDDEVPDDP